MELASIFGKTVKTSVSGVVNIKCKDCKFCKEQWLALSQGLYKFSFCSQLVYDLKMVEPECERECEFFAEKKEEDDLEGDAIC